VSAVAELEHAAAATGTDGGQKCLPSRPQKQTSDQRGNEDSPHQGRSVLLVSRTSASFRDGARICAGARRIAILGDGRIYT
jgi:hypothetical protein